MALDWIKWSVGLTKKREVGILAAKLKISRREMAGTLMELWEWADSETMDGHAEGVTPGFLDELVGVPGLAAAMESVGWLLVDDAGVIFPNFKRHNGTCAKKRALAADRKRQERDRLKDWLNNATASFDPYPISHAVVRYLSRSKCDVSGLERE